MHTGIDPDRYQSAALTVMLSIALMAVLTGCDGGEPSAATVENQAQVVQPSGTEQPLQQVTEFDGFTLRANVSRTEFLPDAMAREHGIKAEPDLALLNVVVLATPPDGQSVPVAAELSAQYENLVGQITVIEMRPVKANGNVSYIGTLDASAARVFRLVIEAQPAGAAQPLQMNFEVRLEDLDTR